MLLLGWFSKLVLVEPSIGTLACFPLAVCVHVFSEGALSRLYTVGAKPK
jgi:hypothetical protein